MINAIKEIFKRELRLTARDINIISIILLAPLFYSFFYGSIYINKVERKLPIVIYDEDMSQTTRTIAEHLNASQMINVTGYVNDFNSGIDKINSNQAYGMVYFPKGFEAGLKLYRGATVKTYLNTTRFLVSNDINIAINEVIINENADIKLKFFEKAGFSYGQAKELVEPVKYDVRPLFNTTESYGDFLIPGIFVLIIQQTLLIGLSESVAKERELGTTGHLFELGKGNIFAVINGKGLLFALIFGAFSLLFFTFNYLVFRINMYGNGAALFIFTFLLIAAAIYFSIFIASFFKKKILAVQFLTISTYPIFLISGYSWPKFAMPLWVQYIADLIPSTPYLAAFMRITKMGAGLGQTMPELIHLAILTSLFYSAAHIRLKQLLKKQTSNNEE